MILVTGGTGLLGSHLLYDLSVRGERIRAIKRPNSNLDAVRHVFSYYSNSPAELFYRIEWVDADMLDIESLIEAMYGVRQVYHAAALVSFDPAEREKIIDNNVAGTRNIVNACLVKSVSKFCHVSSTSALGSSDKDGIIKENSSWQRDVFHTGYSVSKYQAELEAWRGIEEGLQTIIVNPSVILGPGFWNKGSSAMFSAVYRGFKFYTSGVTGYVSVQDVSRAMITLMNSHQSGDRFIISSENLSYRDVFNMIADSLGKKRPYIEANLFMGEMAYRFDKIRELFGAKPLITKEMVASSQAKARFSSEKLVSKCGFRPEPIEVAINRISEYFRKDIREGSLDKRARYWTPSSQQTTSRDLVSKAV